MIRQPTTSTHITLTSRVHVELVNPDSVKNFPKSEMGKLAQNLKASDVENKNINMECQKKRNN